MIGFGPTCNNYSVRDLTADQGTFFWFQLLIDTLVRIPQTDNAKQDFLINCRSYYEDNIPELTKIDEFCQTYDASNAIFWYTRDSFVYRLINKSFRTENIDIIFKFRFFIIDLYKQLQALSNCFIETLLSTKVERLTLYRGQEISGEELQKLRNNIGKLISTNTFLSTTSDRQIAMIFAGNGSHRPLLESVLFEIVIDLKEDEVPTKFANIENLSYFNDENEVLFSVATVFTVGSIEQLDDEDVWTVRLKLSYAEDEQLKKLTEYLRTEMSDQPSIVDLGDLFLNMTDYKRAEKYCKMVMNECRMNKDVTLMKQLHGIIGISHMRRNQSEDAMVHFNIILNMLQNPREHEAFDYVTLGVTYNNIGLVYRYEYDWENASAYYDKALDAYARVLPPEHPLIATVHNNISMIYSLQGNYDQAIHTLERILKIRQEHLPHLHPLISDTYKLLGDSYQKKSDNKLAHYYYNKSLESRDKCLPADSYLLLDTYKAIYKAYIAENDFDEALMYLTKILEARQQSFATIDNSTMAALYLLFVDFYLKKGDYVEAYSDDKNTASIMYKTALDYCQKIIPLSTSIERSHMAVIYIRLGNHQDALHCLELEKSSISESNHVTRGIWYNNMGKVSVLKQDWENAKEYYATASSVYMSILTQDHHLRALLYYNIGEMYEKMKQLHLAQENYRQAYDIYLRTAFANFISAHKCKKAIDRVTKHIADNKLEYFLNPNN